MLSLMQELAVAQSGARAGLAQATRVPALPPRRDLATFSSDPSQNCWRMQPRKTSQGD